MYFKVFLVLHFMLYTFQSVLSLKKFTKKWQFRRISSTCTTLEIWYIHTYAHFSQNSQCSSCQHLLNITHKCYYFSLFAR